MSVDLRCGDALALLREMPDKCVQTCVTSPPYWGLRDYGVAGQLGLERTPEEYVAHMVEVFREVRRVLRDDGTLWLNLGDSYCATPNSWTGWDSSTLTMPHGRPRSIQIAQMASIRGGREFPNLKPKDLVGIPWRVAFALQADGWWLRSDIIWHKPNPMPESVTDRPTKSHEYLFLLSKSARYYYDVDAIREPHIHADDPRNDGRRHTYAYDAKHNQVDPDRQRTKTDCVSFHPNGRNARSVWTITTRPYREAHFATFPPEMPRRCILAGSKPGDTVLDPFAGAGTTGLVADRLGRNFVGFDINPAYVEMARQRIANDAPLFAEGA